MVKLIALALAQICQLAKKKKEPVITLKISIILDYSIISNTMFFNFCRKPYDNKLKILLAFLLPKEIHIMI